MQPTGTPPAYLVTLIKQAQPPLLKRFTDPNLISARRSAMTYAETLAAQLPDEDITTQLEVNLVEQASSTDRYTQIARALRRYISIGPERSGIDTLPLSIIPYEQKRVVNNLTELHQEAQYYLAHGHALGFGTFSLNVTPQNKGHIEPQTLEVLGDSLAYLYASVGGFNSNASDGRGFDLRLVLSTTIYNQFCVDSVPQSEAFQLVAN